MRHGGEAELLKRIEKRADAVDAIPADVELLRILKLHIGFFGFADEVTAERFRTLLGQISVR